MTLGSITAVLARVTELRQLVEPAPVTTQATTATQFDDMMAALGGTDTTGTAGAPATGGKDAQSFIAAAQKYIGTPYVWGAESLDEGGLDCSGLVQRSLADIGVTDVPRVARQQMTMGTAVASMDDVLPGDLLVFGGGTHIAIAMGGGKMLDAPKPGGHVSVRDVYTTPTAIRRILPQAAAAPSPAVTAPAMSAANQRMVLDMLAGNGASALQGVRS